MKKTKKLQLQRARIRVLTIDESALAAGGGIRSVDVCPPPPTARCGGSRPPLCYA